jgi:heat shock protein HslJ
MPDGLNALPFIRTKLQRPRLPEDLVPRPRLLERLRRGLDRKLTLISAQAGAGKSTLLAQWLKECDRALGLLNAPQTPPLCTITAVFSPETDTTGAVSGNATCNSHTTGYTLDGDQISPCPVAGTMMMCPVGADQEAAYLATLDTAQTYQIVGSNLQITFDGGVLNYSSLNLPLENVLWQAVLVLGQPVPEDVDITALFTPGEEEGKAPSVATAAAIVTRRL